MSPRKFPAIVASLVLLAFASALFFPALFQGKILAPLDITATFLPPWNENANSSKPHNQSPCDAVTQYLPYHMFAEESLRKDGYIGWNPYEMGGYSLAANTMALPGSWAMQIHRWLPFKDAWNFGIIAEFLIAGFGMLVFLRSRNLPWLPCLIGAAAFMFNAQFIIWIYHRWALGSFCWMPWVLWSFGDGFSKKIITRKTFLLPAFLALACLGGTLQHLAFIVIACGCLAAGEFNFRRPLDNYHSFLGWSLAFLLAFGIAAYSLVPQIQGFLANNAIGHIRGRLGYGSGLTQPLFHSLLIPSRIWPWLAGDPQSMDAWRLLKSGFMDLNYIGTIPMLLGFAGLFVRSMPRAAKWLIAVGLIIPLTPLIGPLYHRVELLFILGAAWMTAEMLAHLQKSSPIKNQQSTINNRQSLPSPLTSYVLPSNILLTWQRLFIIAVAAIGLILLAATCCPARIRSKFEDKVVSTVLARSSESPFGADKKWIASRAREWTSRFSLTHPRTAWVYGLLVLGSAGLILSSSSKNPKSTIPHQKSFPILAYRPLGQLMILAATSLELTTLFHSWTTFSDPADLHTKNPAIETIRTLAGPHRVLQSAPGAGFTDSFATMNLLAAESIPSIDGYESIQYRSPLIATQGLPDDMRLNLAGVGLAIQPAGLVQLGTQSWPAVATVGNYTLKKNPAVPAPILTGTQTLPTTTDEIAFALTTASPLVASFQSPNRKVFEVPSGSSWIRIAQNWHPGWKWRIPGQSWQPMHNGADATCWIDHLPRMESHLTLEVQFFPRPHWLSYLSLGTALLCLCSYTQLRNWRRGPYCQF